MTQPSIQPSHSSVSSRPTISIVIPSFNAAPWIRSAIDSVLSQPTPVHEVIVQDGASQDGTVDFLRGYDGKLTYVSEPDHGQSDALNRAISRASGDIVGWLNADDLYAPNALHLVQSAFAHHPSADIIYGDFTITDSDGKVIRRYHVSDWRWDRFISHGCYVFSGATFFRRTVFERFGMINPKLHFCMDFEFFLRIGRYVEAIHIPHVLGSLRIHDASKTGSLPFNFVREGHSIRWHYSKNSLRLRAMAMYADARLLAYAYTRPLWLSKSWSTIRRVKRL